MFQTSAHSEQLLCSPVKIHHNWCRSLYIIYNCNSLTTCECTDGYKRYTFDISTSSEKTMASVRLSRGYF